MDRQTILTKLSSGELDAATATALLRGDPLAGAPNEQPMPDEQPIPDEQPRETASPKPKAKPIAGDLDTTRQGRDSARWLRIRVTELNSNRDRVRISIPVGMVRAGLWLGSRFSKSLDETTIRSLTEMLDRTNEGTLLEIEDLDDGERVHIYLD